MATGASRDFAEQFGPFHSETWLDCAHQGPLPRVAVRALHQATRWKVDPSTLDDDLFYLVPDRLRRALADLLHAAPEEVILGNATSYGLHVLANGIDWSAGDEVLLIEGDFPASILSWSHLRDRGVRLRFVEPAGLGPEPTEVADAIGPRTRLLCASWVNSFTGHALDLRAVGEVCRERGVLFAVNGSQGVGSRPCDVSRLPIDALACCGFKWLCGPYGTGFLWVRDELLQRLASDRTYWLTAQRGRSLAEMRDLPEPDGLGAARFDVFGTANFLNFVPWTASVEYFVEAGLDVIQDHDRALVDRLVQGLRDSGYRVDLPESEVHRSWLVYFSHPKEQENSMLVRRLRRERVHVSLREGRIRAAPHLYNTPADIDRAVELLDGLGD